MAKMNSDETEVNARILYWGIEGAGKTANLHSIHRKLRADHRGDILCEATLIDPAVEYETLAIELGDIGGVKTRIQMIADTITRNIDFFIYCLRCRHKNIYFFWLIEFIFNIQNVVLFFQ